jgi:hypothetical protein
MGWKPVVAMIENTEVIAPTEQEWVLLDLRESNDKVQGTG